MAETRSIYYTVKELWTMAHQFSSCFSEESPGHTRAMLRQAARALKAIGLRPDWPEKCEWCNRPLMNPEVVLLSDDGAFQPFQVESPELAWCSPQCYEARQGYDT